MKSRPPLPDLLQRRKNKIHPFLLSILGLLVVFGWILAIREPVPYQAAAIGETPTTHVITATFTPVMTATIATEILASDTPQFTTTATPLPPELLANREQTFGIILGTIVLVILVIGGSLLGILARRRE